MNNLRFLLVLPDFTMYVVTTPFGEEWQMKRWLEGVREGGADVLVDDPISSLPPRSFANLVTDEIEDGFSEEKNAIKPSHALLRGCHGTLMVDGNGSVFYMTRGSMEKWDLPYRIGTASD
jgi:hypothetical protein